MFGVNSSAELRTVLFTKYEMKTPNKVDSRVKLSNKIKLQLFKMMVSCNLWMNGIISDARVTLLTYKEIKSNNK